MNDPDYLSAPETSKWMPLLLSTIAGLSTCIGAGIVFFFNNGNLLSSQVMCFSLALAGSVMVTVSVISIGPECIFEENKMNGSIQFVSIAILSQRIFAFSLGCGLYYLLSWFAFPEPDDILGFKEKEKANNENNDILDNSITAMDEMDDTLLDLNHSRTDNNDKKANETKSPRKNSSPTLKRRLSPTEELSELKTTIPTTNKFSNVYLRGDDLTSSSQKRAWRVTLLLFVSLLFHNFPEGLAVAASTLSSTELGITVMLGIMIHNIPEGIAIAIPCLKARPDQPCLAFGLASISGLAEPLGAWVALVILRWGEEGKSFSLGNVLSFVAGIMITVSFRELFPEAKRYFKAAPEHFATVKGKNKKLLATAHGADEYEYITGNTQEGHDGMNHNALMAYRKGLVSGFILMLVTEWYVDG